MLEDLKSSRKRFDLELCKGDLCRSLSDWQVRSLCPCNTHIALSHHKCDSDSKKMQSVENRTAKLNVT